MQHTTHTSAAPAQASGTVRRTSARYKILALLAIGTMINYLDRTVLGWLRRSSPRSSASTRP